MQLDSEAITTDRKWRKLNKMHGGERIQEKLQTICLNQRCPISEREFLTVKPRGSTDSYALMPREMLPRMLS